MRRNRPDAFEVSFPGERGDRSANNASSSAMAVDQSRSSSVASAGLGKRKSEADEASGGNKRRQLPKAAYYQLKKGEIPEDDKLVIGDEDVDELEDDEKPIREIYNFSVFDPSRRREMVSLEALEQDDGVDRHFEAAGSVVPAYENKNDEDEGQEDDDPDAGDKEVQYVRLSAILRFSIDYTSSSEPVYIETQYAWYTLKTPSKEYQETWEYFYLPHRISQIVISSALELPKETSYRAFLKTFTSMTLRGRTFVESDLSTHAAAIQEVILQEPDMKKIMAVSFVRTILSKTTPPTDTSRRGKASQNKFVPKKKAMIGNIDNAVLKPENQNPTCVTPRIAKLAEGYFNEELKVIGSAPPLVNKAEKAARDSAAHKRLWSLIQRSNLSKKRIKCNKADRVSVKYDFYNSVEVSGETYSIGDTVLVPSMELPSKFDDLPADAAIADYFWFARISYIIMDNEAAHIQWFNHGSKTMLEELAHPQELFLADHCDKIYLHQIAGKVNVTLYPGQLPDDSQMNDIDFFCKNQHDQTLGSFTSLNLEKLNMCYSQPVPDNCPVCPIMAEQEAKTDAQALRDDNGIVNGVAFGGQTFHYEDFVLYRAEQGPANIGYVCGIKLDKKAPAVTVRKVGRIADLGQILPKDFFRDERHLYLTEEKATVAVKELLRVIYVPCNESFKAPEATREDWLDESYDQFYLKWVFPTLHVKDWEDKHRVEWGELHVCAPCCKERLARRKLMYRFQEDAKHHPLPTLDLFGGVGAFSRGLAEGSASLKVTHAIELSPSAAATFSQNSPHTIVYNQCANEMLRYAIKSQQGHTVEPLKERYDDKTPIPQPPKLGEVAVITAGFPCQGHSSLNMYRDAEDRKNNLILTTLSFMDYYSPTFGYFENVPGFLKFALGAQQSDIYTVKGGIEAGGLKLFVRALLDMNYQVRFGLLQAVHYGTPQRRVRLFIVAAKNGEVLPHLPQPTHDFPDHKSMDIKIGKYAPKIAPIQTTAGTAQHRFITIEDAISDLPRFDWKNPNPRAGKKLTSEQQRERRKREQSGIPSFECKKVSGVTFCGIQGQAGYHHQRPRTRYQYIARLFETSDIQQYTKILTPKKVERVVNIPLQANADYQSLPANLGEWQLVDPSSSLGRKNYRPGAYGRLDKNSVFQTTVTNVDPTAKQCHVLHPWCERMLTVRELARSQGFPDNFVFKAIGNEIVTMHRQIGNAVPIPLGHALGRELRQSLFDKWKTQRESAIVIDDNDDSYENIRQHHQGGLEEEDDDDMYVSDE